MSTKNDDKSGLGFFMLVIAFVFSAWGTTWYILEGNEHRGTFGDMFGAVNALFSGLAFGGVIFAIILQRKELSLQRRELELTRDELHGQKEQMRAQNITLKKQNFESTFFQLLRLQNEITNDIDLVDANNRITKGRDCFRVFYDRFKKLWNKNKTEYQGDTELDRINNTYLAFYASYQSEFGHYFRNLYNIFKFIENSELEDKRLYTNLVRAQLSSNELTLLFYNALSEKGNKKFKPLIEKYSLLKTLPNNALLNSTDHIQFYKNSAYNNISIY
jgi:hypothetical protein